MGRRKKDEKELLDSPLASPEARGARVRKIRNMANLTRQQLCENAAININSLKGWEIGRYGGLTSFGAEKIIQYATNQGVQCSLEWLMYGIGVGPSVKPSFETNPLVEYSSPSEFDHTQDEDTKIANELSLFKKHYKNSVDFIVTDEGMEPLYKINEYVAGVSLSGQRIDEVLGFNCITQLENGNILLRLVRKGTEPNTYTLICLNTAKIAEPVLYNTKLIWAAPVIFHRKRNNI